MDNYYYIYKNPSAFVAKVQQQFPQTQSSTERTTPLNYSSSLINTSRTPENITKSIKEQRLHNTSSLTNTIQYDTITIRNRTLIWLSISLLLIILCICFSYCIFTCLKYYLNKDSAMQQDISIVDRESCISAEDSYGPRPTLNYRLSQVLDEKTQKRRASLDSIRLFRF